MHRSYNHNSQTWRHEKSPRKLWRIKQRTNGSFFLSGLITRRYNLNASPTQLLGPTFRDPILFKYRTIQHPAGLTSPKAVAQYSVLFDRKGVGWSPPVTRLKKYKGGDSDSSTFSDIVVYTLLDRDPCAINIHAYMHTHVRIYVTFWNKRPKKDQLWLKKKKKKTRTDSLDSYSFLNWFHQLLTGEGWE